MRSHLKYDSPWKVHSTRIYTKKSPNERVLVKIGGNWTDLDGNNILITLRGSHEKKELRKVDMKSFFLFGLLRCKKLSATQCIIGSGPNKKNFSYGDFFYEYLIQRTYNATDDNGTRIVALCEKIAMQMTALRDQWLSYETMFVNGAGEIIISPYPTRDYDAEYRAFRMDLNEKTLGGGWKL